MEQQKDRKDYANPEQRKERKINRWFWQSREKEERRIRKTKANDDKKQRNKGKQCKGKGTTTGQPEGKVE